ncbi:MAG: GyrI-like domain-containing protein [Gaiellaceae bacterium]
MSDGQVVERESVPVMFRRTTDHQEAITRTWAELEAAVGSLRGRKFYGAFDPSTREYWVCVQRREDDDPEALGLEDGTLPGGRYARERLEGDPPSVYRQIRPTFERLAKQRPDRDPSRHSIEFYRRHDVIELLLPIN